MKTCTKCHVAKPESEFNKDSAGKDGLSSRCRACAKTYVATHKDERKAYNAEHANGIAAYHAKWHVEHKDEHVAYNAKWNAEHSEAIKAYYETRRTRIVGNGGSFTEEEWNALLLFYDFKCLACGRNDVLLTADHVVPVSMGGSSDIGNIQPLCKSCNSSKGPRYIDYRPDADELVQE